MIVIEVEKVMVVAIGDYIFVGALQVDCIFVAALQVSSIDLQDEIPRSGLHWLYLVVNLLKTLFCEIVFSPW
jgi:hypothetical protein